jgi:hypothetical protein
MRGCGQPDGAGADNGNGEIVGLHILLAFIQAVLKRMAFVCDEGTAISRQPIILQ